VPLVRSERRVLKVNSPLKLFLRERSKRMIPALVQWEITDRCNLRCPHCYHVDPRGKVVAGQDLGKADMQKIAEIIVGNKLFFVTFTGGEPLIRKDLLVEIVQYLYDHNVIISLNTNLLLMDEGLLSRLKVHRMLVSCPSVDPQIYAMATGNGDYNKFETKLTMLIDTGINHTVNMVVSKLNQNSVRHTAKKMAEIGVTRFAATPASVNARYPDFTMLLSSEEVSKVIDDLIWVYETLGMEVDIMESVPKCIMPSRAFELELPFIYRSCHAGRRNGTISTNGEVRPCSHNPQIFGNILGEDIGEIWNRIGNWREKSGNYHMDCLGCDIFSYCGGGCRVDSSIRQNKTDATHPYMAEKMSAPSVKPATVALKSDLSIRPVRSFQARQEDGMWLVAPGSSRNIIKVNQQLYNFLVATRKLQSMTIQALAEHFGTSFESPHFQRVVTLLIRKKFFLLSDN